MKSFLPLERSIRRDARERLRASPNQWKEYRRNKPGLRQQLAKLRLFLVIYPALILIVFGQRSPELPLILLTLYCAATVFGRSTSLERNLHVSGDLAFFMHTPVPDQEFFSYVWRKFCRSSALLVVYSMLAFGYVAVQEIPGALRWPAAVAAATLQWLLVVSLIVLLAVFFPAWQKMKLGWLLYGATFAVIFLPVRWIPEVRQGILPLPTAWIPYVFQTGIAGHEIWSIYALIPALVLIALLPMAVRRFRNAYPLVELVYPLASPASRVEVDAIGSYEEMGEWDSGADVSPLTTTGTRIPSITLPALDWEGNGWLERRAGRWLNARERSVATFLLGGESADWSSRWRLSLKIALGGVILTLLPQLVPTWACIAVGSVASMLALPVFGGTWKGTQPHWVASGRVMPMFAGFPISYSEMSRVLIKVALIRFAAWAPFFIPYGTLVAWREGIPVVEGARLAGLTFLVLLSLLPLVVAGQHSKGTSDSRRLTLQSALAITALIILTVLFFSTVGLMFAGSTLATPGARAFATLAGALGMFLCTGLAWRGYMLFYERGRVDLLRPSSS